MFWHIFSSRLEEDNTTIFGIFVVVSASCQESDGRILGHTDAGYIVVHGNGEENGFAAADAAREKVDIVNLSFINFHALAFDGMRNHARELRLVAAVGVDLGIRSLEKHFNE